MECTDSNVSIDKTSKNKVSAVGAEKVLLRTEWTVTKRQEYSQYQQSSCWLICIVDDKINP